MNILVTGGAGYIGSHTCIELLSAGFNIIVVDNLSNSDKRAIDKISEISGRSFSFYQIDICQPELKQVFEENAIDAVIHFAGLKAVGESTKYPLEYFHNNVSGSVNLLRLMHEFKVENFVFSSSATVYGNPKQMPICESAPLSPQSPYGESKLMVEDICRSHHAANPETTFTLLRYFNPVGAHKSGEIGENPSGIPNNLMPYISQVAVGELAQLSIYGDDYNTPDGTGVRDYIHVVDLAIGHVKAITELHNSGKMSTFNLGTGVGYSVLEVVNTFAKINAVEINTTLSARRAGDVETCFADTTAANRELDWRAQYSLEDMVSDVWRWQKKYPNGFESSLEN
jgi:UDP-glucose 4-epimerase